MPDVQTAIRSDRAASSALRLPFLPSFRSPQASHHNNQIIYSSSCLPHMTEPDPLTLSQRDTVAAVWATLTWSPHVSGLDVPLPPELSVSISLASFSYMCFPCCCLLHCFQARQRAHQNQTARTDANGAPKPGAIKNSAPDQPAPPHSSSTLKGNQIKPDR